MSKILSAYGGFTATQLKTRASVPTNSNITVSGSDIICDNIKMSDVTTALGIWQNDSIYNVCNSSNVNIYSQFSPRYWILVNGVLSSTVTASYALGNFCGYNHNATAPYFTFVTSDYNVYEGGTTTTVIASLLLGEIRWLDLPFLKSVNMEVQVNGSVVDTQHIELNSSNYCVTSQSFSSTFSTVGWNSPKTITLRFFFGKDASHDWTELCAIPNISNQTINVGYIYRARLRSFSISYDLQTYWGGTANISYNNNGGSGAIVLNNYRNNNYVEQSNGTFRNYWYGIDTDGDYIGDKDTRFTTNLYYWAKKNNDSWTIVNQVLPKPHYEDNVNSIEDISWLSLTHGDLVDVEIRYVPVTTTTSTTQITTTTTTAAPTYYNYIGNFYYCDTCTQYMYGVDFKDDRSDLTYNKWYNDEISGYNVLITATNSGAGTTTTNLLGAGASTCGAIGCV